jgi:hypothetical protein
MFKSAIKKPYRHFRKTRICQGDIFHDLLITIGSGSNTLHIEAVLEYAVVLTQDCDLQQDFVNRKKHSNNNDKDIDTILVCPAYSLEDFAQGRHIKDRHMQSFTAKELNKKFKPNDMMKRYHYLVEDLENGVPELVIDFKQFLTVPRYVLYGRRKTNYLTTIN